VSGPIQDDLERVVGRALLLVLAAGASERHGGRPKALLEVDGEPAVRRVLRVARSVGMHEAVVVVGRHQVEIESALAGDPVVVVRNAEWELGRTGSIQAALRSRPADTELLLWPVDHPFVGANTVRALLAAARHDPMAAWIMPTFEGGGGHPVWLASAATRLIRGLAADAPLRSLIPRLGVQVLRMPTSDPWVRVGTDTPEEYSAAISRRRPEERD
jgi:molybdenum cofactor cytidylyltransferase